MGVCERWGAAVLETILPIYTECDERFGDMADYTGLGQDDLFHFVEFKHLGYTQNIYQRSQIDP